MGEHVPSGTIQALEAAVAVELTGESPAVIRLRQLVRDAAAATGGVLLVAERGMDVEGVARYLHGRSRSATSPWVAVDCRAAEGASVDRLLFGTPALDGPPDLEPIAPDSRVAAARGGTLFLSDITELPAGVQARLARVVRDGEVRIRGEAVALDIRFVGAAPATIDADLHEHRLRADLYRRLAVSRIDLVPLRERAADVPALAARLLEEACAHHGLGTRAFTQAALALLGALHWPGNLAELREVVDRVAVDAAASAIHVEHVIPALQTAQARAAFRPARNLREARLQFEREYIAAVLQHHSGRVSAAARTLGIQRPNLYRKARQLGIAVTRRAESA